MVDKKGHCLTGTVRELKDSDFVDVHVDFDNYAGEKRDPILIGKLTLWSRFLLWLDNFLLKNRRKKHV